MSKLDIRGNLKKRKFKTTNRFFYWLYKVIMDCTKGFRYHAHYERVDDISKCKGPCFVIFNHLSRIDHYYCMKAAYPKRINMLAGYNEFFRSHLHLMFQLNNVLPKKQYDADLSGTKAMMEIIKKGGSIFFAPEGLATNDGMPKPIVPKTGNLFKHYKIPVYVCELRGQYLQNTKNCLDERYGETYAKTYLLFKPEDLEKLSVDEIDDKINEAFRHDEFEWQKEKHIKWKTNGRICERIDDMLFECPKCHSKFEMEGKENYIKCKCCGNGATMDDYYDFHPFEGSIIPETPSKWVNEQRVHIIKEIRKNKEFVFTEKVEIGRLPNDHYLKNLKTSEVVSKGTLTVDHNGVKYVGEDNHEVDFELNYKQIYTVITELDSSYFNIYVNGEYTDIFPERHTALYIGMLIEEMHRLHVNKYKNFKWNDWMYENIEE